MLFALLKYRSIYFHYIQFIYKAYTKSYELYVKIIVQSSDFSVLYFFQSFVVAV